MFAKIVQRNYTVDMDLPADGNILLNHDDMGSVGKYDPIYISSIRNGMWLKTSNLCGNILQNIVRV